jgi:hypothetical protein
MKLSLRVWMYVVLCRYRSIHACIHTYTLRVRTYIHTYIHKRISPIGLAPGILPLVGSGKNVVQPIYVDDVAEAVRAAVFDDVHDGKTYELVGPTKLTVYELAEWVRVQIWKDSAKTRRVPDMTAYLPEDMAAMSPHAVFAKIADIMYRAWPQALPGMPALLGIRGDVNMIHSVDWTANENMLQLKDLGIPQPVDWQRTSMEYLRHYRQGGHFVTIKEGRGTQM